MMSYDAFAETFSNSRKNLFWPELEYTIEDMRKMGYTSALDIGCGNGRFLEQIEDWGLRILNYLGIDSSRGMIVEAQKLHPEQQFKVIRMQDITTVNHSFDALILLASFHHLETRWERIQFLQHSKKLLTLGGRIYMTNWNLRDQKKYTDSHRWDSDYDIKIGAYFRYYHGFTVAELTELFEETGYRVIENRIFEWGRNIISILETLN